MFDTSIGLVDVVNWLIALLGPIVVLYLGNKITREFAPTAARNVAKDIALIDMAREEVWLSGINALGPLHQGREKLISLLDRGGSLRVLMLDPASQAFQDRCDHENDQTGRLQAEYQAALAICRDIASTAEGRNAVEVKVAQFPLGRSMVFIDAESKGGSVNVNTYPKRRGVRGLTGPQRTYGGGIASRSTSESARFSDYLREFCDAWNREDTKSVYREE